MNRSRRGFLGKGGQFAATGMLGLWATGCTQSPLESAEESAGVSLAPSEKPPEPETPKAMVAACGLSCMACPMMKAEKCKGCAAKAEMAKMKEMEPCPVFECAAMKEIDYCGTGCKKFAECAKLIGHPYAQSYMDMMKTRMDDSA